MTENNNINREYRSRKKVYLAFLGVGVLVLAMFTVMYEGNLSNTVISNNVGTPIEPPVGKPLTDIQYERQTAEKNLEYYFCFSQPLSGEIKDHNFMRASQYGPQVQARILCETDSQLGVFTVSYDAELKTLEVTQANNNQTALDNPTEPQDKMDASIVGQPMTKRQYERQITESALEHFLCMTQMGYQGLQYYDMLKSQSSNGTITSTFFCKSDTQSKQYTLYLDEAGGKQIISEREFALVPDTPSGPETPQSPQAPAPAGLDVIQQKDLTESTHVKES